MRPFSRLSTRPKPIRRTAVCTALAVLAALLTQLPARADATPFEVLPADPLANFTQFKNLPTDSTELVPITGNPDFTEALEVTVPNGPQSPGLDGEYEITLGVPAAATVTAGDAMVANVWARVIEPIAGSSTGNAHLVFETDGSPYKKSMNAALLYGSTWQKFEFPFRAAVTYTAGTTTAAHLNLWLGYGAQKFQIAGVSVQDWGPGTPAGYPQITYEGRDANAAWRTAANARIDQYRKGNLALSVVNTEGQPVSGATVSAVQQTSAFKFGAASDGARLIGDPSSGISASDLAQYQSKVSTLFNQGALGNNLKWSNHWENQVERDTITMPALQWMRERGLRVRGHTLIWPSWGYMPPDLVTLQNDPAALRARVNNHITDEATTLKGLVDEWDVVNEPYSEHSLQDILGPNEIASWFQLADQADPTVPLALNDYGLLENNGWEKRHRDHVYGIVQSLKASGAPIDLIGFESHFNGLQLTSPDDLMTIVDQFAGLGVKAAITEFDVDTDDLQLQADYTRDFMTVMFSNPNVNQISNFGIWANNIYNPRVALYNADWSPKPNGLVWEDLIKRQWHTSVSGQTNAAGTFGTRGFLGDYLVTVTVNGISKQVKVPMPTTAGASAKVIIDGNATTVRTEQPNPVGDGDFESGNRGWTPLGTGPGTALNAHSGHSALSLSPGSGVTQNITGLTTGTSYLLSGWGRLSGGGTQCYIGVRGGSTVGAPSFQYELSYADERAYTQKLAAFTPPAGTKWTQVFAWSNPNPTSAECTLDDIAITPTDGTPPPAQAPPAMTPYLPTPSVLGNGTLENQSNTTGWYCLGTCTLKNASTTPHTGSGDLSVTARGAAWAGPAQGVSVVNGGLYDSSAWVRLAGTSGTDTAMVSVKVTTSTGSTTVRFGTAPVSSTGWTRISASNVKVAWTGTFTKAEWWISTTTGTTNLLVDDASFAPMAKTVAGRDLLINGDAEQSADNWTCATPCVVQGTTAQMHLGASSVLASGRAADVGPAQVVTVTNGASYKTSAWVRLAAGSSTAQVRLKLTKSDGSVTFVPLASAAVNASGWTKVAANNVPVSWTGALTKAEWVVSTPTTDNLYVDDAALQPAGIEQTAFNPVQPTAACVVRNSFDNTYTAYFGYSNANDYYIPVPIGSDNAFNPGPSDRGQTVSFLPYQRPRRVAVTWNGSSLTWRLGSVTQIASSTTPACGAAAAASHRR
ncbi:GH35 family endo-1,4-beta-xylanase [Kribbella sp. VKM Ac-2527]|uniref:Beta-xylanase n=1 Tax=Kribbella caucasensis TaxID=2512215 RepID=A0A4R6K4M8_9ACTN|nr:endo-1,4-beta-xylanase [Kribbella sp. VKM Ac-2527]TDO44323.1 GH35 family endo-1,4-beta-xylanase [Kribbella sp. VKM Ac-2527]